MFSETEMILAGGKYKSSYLSNVEKYDKDGVVVAKLPNMNVRRCVRIRDVNDSVT